MVVLTNGEIDKSQYRKFKIKITGKPNDYAMHAEMAGRRLKHTEWPLPDLFIIDGGMLQQWGTLPFGILTMMRMLAQLMDMTTNQLSTLLQLYTKDLLADTTRENIQRLFNQVIISWKKDLQTFLGSAVVNGSIIDQVFWMGDNQALLALFINSVASEKIAFPLIFGTHEIGNRSITSLLAPFSVYESFSREITHDQDIIIKIALSL
jgi:hypothetical protein